MATATVSSPAANAPRKLYPHAQWYFFAAIVVTWIGFSRSYFLQLGSVTIYHHIHGAIAGGWIATLIIQPILYQRGQMRLHRKLGKLAAYGLAPLMVLFASIVMHLMFAGVTGIPPIARYVLGYLDFMALWQFPLFVFLSVYYRKNLALHARWITGTVLLLLPPAMVRAMFLLPFVHGFVLALNLAFGTLELILVLLMLDDRRYGRIRAPYPIMLVMFLGIHFTMRFAAVWPWWHAVADWWGRI